MPEPSVVFDALFGVDLLGLLPGTVGPDWPFGEGDDARGWICSLGCASAMCSFVQ